VPGSWSVEDALTELTEPIYGVGKFLIDTDTGTA
jgi:hypothetical protein